MSEEETYEFVLGTLNAIVPDPEDPAHDDFFEMWDGSGLEEYEILEEMAAEVAYVSETQEFVAAATEYIETVAEQIKDALIEHIEEATGDDGDSDSGSGDDSDDPIHDALEEIVYDLDWEDYYSLDAYKICDHLAHEILEMEVDDDALAELLGDDLYDLAIVDYYGAHSVIMEHCAEEIDFEDGFYDDYPWELVEEIKHQFGYDD